MTRIVWKCDTCSEPIEDRQGVVYMPDGATRKYEEEKAEWDKVHPPEAGIRVGELMDMPRPAAWVVSHFDCDPNADKGGWGLDVRQLRTPSNVIYWIRHLEGKPWITSTRWERLLSVTLESFPEDSNAHS